MRQAQALEVSEYDQLLQGFQRASVTTEVIGATLNAGQSIVLAGGLTAVLVVASLTGTSMTAGDLVRCSGSLDRMRNSRSQLGSECVWSAHRVAFVGAWTRVPISPEAQ